MKFKVFLAGLLAAVLFYEAGSPLAYLAGGVLMLVPLALGWKLPRPKRD